MADRTIKQNNRLPALTIVARDDIGPVDLDGVTAMFRMVHVLTGALKVNASATVKPNVNFTASGATLTAAGHGLVDGESVTLKTTGTLPTGLSAQQEYFVVNSTSSTLQLALTKGGTPITTTSAGSGVHALLAGRIDYEWASSDTDTAGTYFGEIQTTKDGKDLSYPNTRHFIIEIISELVDGSDRTLAVKAVIDRVHPDVMPKLSQGEIELEVDRAQLVKVWQPNTSYKVGEVVVPSERNGHSYVCVQPGTSQSGLRDYFDWPDESGWQFGDGNSNPGLIWEECGTDRFNPSVFGAETNIYDINRAARECWKLKARKASQMIADGDVSFDQLHKNCLEHAGSFRPFRRQAVAVRMAG